MTTELDISDTLEAKSDQLNAADLAQPITVRVSRVTVHRGEDQPVSVHLDGHKPWKPCKSMRRLLAQVWGTDASQWQGEWLELYNDASVMWAGEPVGGIRVSGATGIERTQVVKLPITRGKYGKWTVRPIQPPVTVDRLAEVLEDARLTVEAVDLWRESTGKGPVSDLTDEQRAQLGNWLARDESRLETVRAFLADDGEE